MRCLWLYRSMQARWISALCLEVYILAHLCLSYSQSASSINCFSAANEWIKDSIVLFRRLPAWRYNRLAVGLDNKSPWDSAPQWLQYALCGRYLGPTPTPLSNLTIQCTDVGNANRYRYVILQTGYPVPRALCLNEVYVFVNGKHNNIWYLKQVC